MATHVHGTQPVAPPTAAAPMAGSLRKAEPKRLSLSLLIALVVGSMIGSGIFSLPQNMAASAGAGAILIGWLITGVGMLSLALVYQTLSNRQPALDNGVFAYARGLGGDFLGFYSAWGYWISAWIGNVSYLVILFAALSYFFPLFGEGNNKAAIDLWEHAVGLQDALNYSEPPAWYPPVRAMLGKLYLANNQPADAEKVFRQDLERNPRHGRSLAGLRDALKAQNREYEADQIDRQFRTAWKVADTTKTSAR